jgi:hypothetical protein
MNYVLHGQPGDVIANDVSAQRGVINIHFAAADIDVIHFVVQYNDGLLRNSSCPLLTFAVDIAI